MTIDDLKARVGRETYEMASRHLRSDVDYEAKRGDDTQAQDAAHDIGDLLLYDADISDVDRVRLMFEVYRDLPTYGLLMYGTDRLSELSQEAQDLFWDQFRELLAHPNDALADQVAYTLWCELFEDPSWVGEAWKVLTKEPASDLLLQRVLIHSGPVPYDLKRELYERLLPDEKWHYYIYRSLLHSAFDVYGKIHRKDAGQVLEQLELADDLEHLGKLQDKLSDLESGKWVKL